MKFKTRLLIIFISIAVLPLVLTTIAYIGIGNVLNNGEGGISTPFLSGNMAEVVEDANNTLAILQDQIDADVTRMEDVEYLREINKQYGKSSTYLLVRKGDTILFAGDRAAAEIIFKQLPAFGAGSEDYGRYYDKYSKLVKQLDFTFADGSEGSAFIIARISNLISKHLLIDMLVAIIIILIGISVLLTRSLQKGIIEPINKLNIAMQKIKEGNFDYSLTSTEQSEIGSLYRNYEDMRLRLKESTQEARRSEEQNREMISNISHDLKTPITAIKGYASGIMDGVADTPEKIDKYVRTIHNKANDMERLINELTYYSRIDNNRIPYNFHRINVADYFGDCIEEVGIDLEQRNIKLNYINTTQPDTMVIADPEQMKKVINNIISNSVKYMDKPNGRIDILIRDEDDSVCIEIADNGRGIAQKDLGKIFERFYRTDASRNSSQGGSGIGLSIVKKIIEDHGGYIWATAKEGEGTSMHFVLRKYIELNDANN